MSKGRSRSRDKCKRLLYGHTADRLRIAEITDDYIFGRRGTDGQGRSRGPGDPTGRAALGIATDPEALEVNRRLATVNMTIVRVRRKCTDLAGIKIVNLAEQVYFRRAMTLAGYARSAGVSEKTARRWNKILLQTVAEVASEVEHAEKAPVW